MQPKTIIFIGRSGCGKGTQVAKLIEKMRVHNSSENAAEIFHLESGARFRQFIQGNGDVNRLAKEITDRGGLQPEFLSVWVWATELIEQFQTNEHLIIDGTPRRLREAYVLESAFEFFQRKEIDVIHLDVSEDWAKERMAARGRGDDKDPADVIKRLEWFKTDVVPVLEHYKHTSMYRVHVINGEQSIDDVHNDIVKSLGI